MLFTGSTSQFEPYHSFGLWHYTPCGFRVLVEEAGLALEEIRPSLDGVTLIMRTCHAMRKQHYGRYWRQESPLNTEIDAWARARRRKTALVNLRKLTFCGQFAFRVRTPGLRA
ncbi:hypothetical protein ACIPSA_28790 [Streptomyces sp. NPDC086549]|uniref:hypothetical protein n=1 Tax=Streptomyces sp. NPDC086549 TaxID=3365752 RepID=UPI00382A855C